ncbi:MAG: BTAD domain-containing putative transcriptional regulator [Candidatus Limnocylindrales bacterium]
MNSSVIATKVRIPSAPSMPVDRLDARLDGLWAQKLALVVAPAGSGKTTLLSRLALRAPGPVGWYRAEGWDRDEAALLAHIEAALVPALKGIPTDWESVADAANALEAWKGDQALLVIDDLHTLQGTPAEAALERLIDCAPPNLTFAVASRVPPGFNLPRMRVSGALLEFSGDDLRFRSWEVERLFHDFYDEPLPPEELARLARRTEGWAAGLQLFHLATRGRPPDERRRLLGELGSSSRFTREYLTRNVLHQLPADLRRFLLDSSVLGRLSAHLCDRLLDRRGSGEILADLERRRLFTQPLPEDGEYRYHEVLRSYLHAALLEELGEAGMHERFRAAGSLLATSGAVPEAVEAYCRGEDWDSARRLLASEGAAVADAANAWVDALPTTTALHDPWLLLASARRLRAEGYFREAIDRYQRAELAFGSADAAMLCRDERQGLASWLDGSSAPRTNALAALRAVVRGEQVSSTGAVDGQERPADTLVAGMAALVAGNASIARRELLHAAERPEASGQAQVVGSLVAGVAGLLMGQRHAVVEIEGAVASAEAVGLDWLARLGRASLALTGAPEALREAEAVAVACAGVGDAWGEALARLCASWGALVAHRDVTAGDELVRQLRQLDAPALEACARGIVALAAVRAGEADSRDMAAATEAAARSTGSNAARLLAYLGLAEASADLGESEEFYDLALSIAQETGLQAPMAIVPRVEPIAVSHAPPVPPVSVRVLGAFEIRLAGQQVDLSAIRPRARALLRLLSMNAGTPVHHETIEGALWPDADAEASARNLHVAIAALRRVLEPAAVRGSFQLLRRAGDAYLFDAPAGSDIDIERFERAVSRGRVARERSDAGAAAVAYQEALYLYRGDLLPEDGPAEWVADRREACRLAAVEVTQALAEILLASGEAADAARTCAIGLQIERYHDPLWRLLIRARDQAGDQGAASRARLGYDRMLAELGIPGDAASSSPL